MADPSTSTSTRRPKPLYRGHNGFTTSVELAMAGTVVGSLAAVNLHAVAADRDSATKEERQALYDAVQRRQFVEDMMELKGTFFPGLDAIRRENESSESASDLKERIQEAKKRHLEEVRTLYEWHAQDYYDEVLDMSRSKLDIEDPDVEAFYRTSRPSFDIAASFDDQLDRHHYAHLVSLYPLTQQYNKLRKQEEDWQRQRDKQFPTNVEDFRAIRNKDVQLRIARYLTSDDVMRERIMDEYGWAYMQTTPLCNEYKESEVFKMEVHELLQRLLREVESRDPRKARLSATATT
ncbi:hypothetical protein GSI_12778 [Ganoderma sinense ZZ0214-1]|uniref:Uncharacterized protein n=1 Tax=Ganoderma sinense ZZ0214-1 TaxID=1077348 RepID=A0A2G8RTQ3_9APHY|nr:hypothetical protein GSI_12778 [Ganoderma sinense ZZ0214-1]